MVNPEAQRELTKRHVEDVDAGGDAGKQKKGIRQGPSYRFARRDEKACLHEPNTKIQSRLLIPFPEEHRKAPAYEDYLACHDAREGGHTVLAIRIELTILLSFQEHPFAKGGHVHEENGADDGDQGLIVKGRIERVEHG